MLELEAADAVLVREAGIPFQLPPNNSDPIAEWLSMMEVVQVLCLCGLCVTVLGTAIIGSSDVG